MSQSVLLSIEPVRGGVPRLLHVLHDWLQQRACDPTVVYVDAESVPTRRWKLLRYHLRHWRPYQVTRDGMNCWAVPRYPGSYAQSLTLPWRLLPNLLTQTPIRVAVTGGAQTALPFALAGKPFGIWVATLYEDELQARAAAGDAWAAQFLLGREWQKVAAAEARVLRAATTILALSDNTAQRIASCFPEVSSKITTVPYPVDTSFWNPPALPADPPYLLLTARSQDPRKNIRLLLESFADLAARYPSLELVITGDSPSTANTTFLQQNGLESRAHFVGQVSDEQLRALYRGASIFCLPSNQEGLAISVLEALACGVPVVSTRCGGPESIITQSGGGILTPLGDRKAFASAIAQLMDSPAQRAEMGVRGTTYIQQRCSPAALHRHFEALLSALQ